MTDKPENDDLIELLQNSVIFRISRTNNILSNCSALLTKHAAQLNLTDWRMLVFLGGGSINTAADIIQQTKYDPAMVSRSLNSVIKLGYVLSEPDAVDKRINRLRLTEKGLETYQLISKAVRNHVDRVEAGFSQEDLDKLFSMLEKFRCLKKLKPPRLRLVMNLGRK
ncbi:MAG: MarR family winged helix-turn-helix transcriptional regulator [Pikeienuella sp.]